MDHKTQLIGLLGIGAEATDETIANSIAAFRKDLVDFKSEAEGRLTTLQNSLLAKDGELTLANSKVTEVQGKLIKATEELVNRDMLEFKDVIKDETAVRTQLLANRDTTRAFLAGLKVTPAAPATTPPPAPLHNSKIQNQPAPVVNAPVNSPEAIAASKKLANRAAELRKTLGLSFQQSWTQAQGEIAKETK